MKWWGDLLSTVELGNVPDINSHTLPEEINLSKRIGIGIGMEAGVCLMMAIIRAINFIYS